MEYALSALWSALELVSFGLFWGAFQKPRLKPKLGIWVFAAAWICSIIYTSLDLDALIKQAVSLGMLLIANIILYSGPWYQRLLVIFLGYLLGGIVDTATAYGVAILLQISLADLMWRILSYSITVTTGKLITLLLAWIFYRRRKSSGSHLLRGNWLLLTLLFPMVSLAILAVVFSSYRDTKDLSSSAVLFSVILAIANITIIYLIQLMEKNTKEQEEMILLRQQMNIQTDSMLALERNYKSQRQLTHEFNSQIQTINDLLAQKKYDVAFAYVQKLRESQTTRIFAVNSHHPIVDVVLNQKYQIAKDNGIDMQVEVNDLSELDLETNVLVVLLSNLLDNAIEACMRIGQQRLIECTMLLTDSLYISIRNTSAPVEIINNSIATSKEPKIEHGFGLPRIKHILDQLQSEYTFVYEDGWFQFVAELPLN